MDTFPDLGSLSDQELKDLIQQLTDEEQEVSYRRRILHGKIDILRAELVDRVKRRVGDQSMLLLLSSPEAMSYYPTIGLGAVTNGWMIKRVS